METEERDRASESLSTENKTGKSNSSCLVLADKEGLSLRLSGHQAVFSLELFLVFINKKSIFIIFSQKKLIRAVKMFGVGSEWFQARELNSSSEGDAEAAPL